MTQATAMDQMVLASVASHTLKPVLVMLMLLAQLSVAQ
jgi:hypothetical protein